MSQSASFSFRFGDSYRISELCELVSPWFGFDTLALFYWYANKKGCVMAFLSCLTASVRSLGLVLSLWCGLVSVIQFVGMQRLRDHFSGLA